jgi:hypothetical protein
MQFGPEARGVGGGRLVPEKIAVRVKRIDSQDSTYGRPAPWSTANAARAPNTGSRTSTAGLVARSGSRPRRRYAPTAPREPASTAARRSLTGPSVSCSCARNARRPRRYRPARSHRPRAPGPRDRVQEMCGRTQRGSHCCFAHVSAEADRPRAAVPALRLADGQDRRAAGGRTGRAVAGVDDRQANISIWPGFHFHGAGYLVGRRSRTAAPMLAP